MVDFNFILRKKVKEIKILFLRGVRKRLFNQKFKQKKEFNNLKGRFIEIYSNYKKDNIENFLSPFWKDVIEKLEKQFLEKIPFSFLKNSEIVGTMFVSARGKWLKKQLRFLENKVSENTLKSTLIEDYVGEPIIMNRKYLTSHNSIHHLYHIIKFLDATRYDIKKVETIIEWGGGYGNLAKIIKRFFQNTITYIIIDIPFMSCLQWLYLCTIFGENEINIIQKKQDVLQRGKINLLPLDFLKQFDLKGDLFISTWAITESSEYSQNLVLNLNWFNCEHILLGYYSKVSNFPMIIIPIIENDSEFIIEEIKFLPNNKYAFK